MSTKELKNTHKYDDIINAQRPEVPEGHPRMSVQNRAKIFSPFAALRGYGEKISDENTKEHYVDLIRTEEWDPSFMLSSEASDVPEEDRDIPEGLRLRPDGSFL